MNEEVIKLAIHLDPNEDIDREELAELTRQLKNEINELDVESVESICDNKGAPKGTKAIDAITIGSLLVTLSSQGGVLTSLIGIIGSWLTFKGSCKVVLEIDGDKIEVTNISSSERAQLVDLWINRHIRV